MQNLVSEYFEMLYISGILLIFVLSAFQPDTLK